MSTFFEELKRRNVFRVAIVYIVVGSVVMQVADFLAPLLRLPEWTVSMALYIGIVGFPFALVFAWAFELTPEGLKRSSDVLPDESIAHETGAKLNRLVIGLMALAIVGLLVDRYFPLTRSRPLRKPKVTRRLRHPLPLIMRLAGRKQIRAWRNRSPYCPSST